ncbi:MAG: thiamine-phosphate kinase [Candidatus Omnitrophota bacterium]|nr:thiamine-phosphate kinase [Candidatus Omnitrophota bacterium]
MTAVHALGEAALIDRLRRRLGATARSAHVRIGIGDDAAVLAGPGGRLLLFASDMVVEGVHFLRRTVAPRWIGWKALAVNLSDIAAMGGEPLAAVISLGLPPATPVTFVDGLYEGLAACARRCRCPVVGGDTVRAPQVVVDVAILGTVQRRHLTRRSGAQVGDVLFVTGRLGGSLSSGRHARFVPRLREAQALVRQVKVHAMMDLSDGLASDLWQMSRASRVVLRIRRAVVPVARAAGSVEHALTDGEDFELLFAVSRRDAARVPRRIGSCPVTRIGSVVGRGVRVEQEYPDGRIRSLIPTGFRHF